MAIFGGLALLHFALAVGLWRRSRLALRAALAYIVLSLLCWGAWFASDPIGDGAGAAVPFCFNLALLAYLWLRRQHFGPPQGTRPVLWSVKAAAAAAAVLILGGSWIMIACVDMPPKQFPQLRVERPSVKTHQNAFPVLVSLQQAQPAEHDEYWAAVEDRPEEPACASEDWLQHAEEVLSAREASLAGVEEMLSRQVLVVPVRSGFDWFDGEPALSFGRELAWLLALESDVQAARGRTEQAFQSADRIVDLGLMIAEEPEGAIHLLVGHAVIALGLGQIRRVAAGPQIRTEDMGRHGQLPSLEMKLQESVRRMFRREFAGMMGFIEALAELRTLQELPEARGLDRYDGLLEEVPFVKPNMTRNVAAPEYVRLLQRVDCYQPTPTRTASGPFGVAVHVSVPRFLMNPIGVILVSMTLPAQERLVQCHFAEVARVRMTRIWLALRAHHLAERCLPKTLDELEPEYMPTLPDDPFVHAPFLYEPDAEPPRISSAGPDQQPDTPGETEGDDITVELGFATMNSNEVEAYP